MIAFVNYIAEKIEPEFPNVAVDTFAYQYTRKPPKTHQAAPQRHRPALQHRVQLSRAAGSSLQRCVSR